MEKERKKIAIIEIAGIQVLVKEGENYEVSKLEGSKGDKKVIEQVLFYSDEKVTEVGNPYVKDRKVEIKIDSQKKGEKIDGFKYKAKARYRKKFGSRPEITRFIVESIH